MSSFPQPDPDELPPMPTDPTFGIPTQIPPDGPQIGLPDPFNTPEPVGTPEGPDDGGEDEDFPAPPELEPVVDSGDPGTTVADAGDTGDGE
jgi:hypothetical protein